jgi:DNA-binding response OmpR family regulator
MAPHSMNILLIDDDRDFLFLLSKSIGKHGYHVYTALNGMKALDELHDHKIDLIISDVLMSDTPIMSLTCTLKNLYPKTPIILISGLPEGPLISNSLTLGADEFIPKPINMNLLFNTIDKLGGAQA